MKEIAQSMNNGLRDRPTRREGWVILTILLVFLTGLPAIFIQPAEAILFNPESYKQALEAERAYDQFPQLVGQLVAVGGNAVLFGSGSQMLKLMQSANYETVIRQIFPKEWVQAQAGSLIDQFWAYFNFHSPRFGLVIDMRPVKERLSGDAGQPVAASIIQGLPACTQDDVMKFLQQMLGGSLEGLPLCRPPEQVQQPVILLVQEIIKGAAAAMPEQLDMAALLHLPFVPGSAQVSRAWTAGFTLYHFLRLAGPWLPWIALLLLALTGILARGTVRGLFYWLGLGLLLPGLTALVTAFLFGLGGGRIVPLLITQASGSDLLIFDLLTSMVARVVNRFAIVSALVAFVVLAVGVILLAVSYGIDQRRGVRTAD